MRHDNALVAYVGLMMVVVLVAVAFFGVQAARWYSSGGDVRFSLDLEVYGSAADGFYRVDTDLSTEPQTFWGYATWFPDGPGFPDGNARLSVRIYEGEASVDTGEVLWADEWRVESGYAQAEAYTIEGSFDLEHGDNHHIWVHVSVDGVELASHHYLVDEGGYVEVI